MNLSPRALLTRVRSSQTAIRYVLTSVVTVVVTQVLLAFFQLALGWSGQPANIASCSLAAVPSFLLNRYWAWGKRGRSHLTKEVLPFWGLALLGLALSTWAVGVAENRWSDSVLIVNTTSLAAFGTLWVAKFIFLNEVLFRRPRDLEMILDRGTRVSSPSM